MVIDVGDVHLAFEMWVSLKEPLPQGLQPNVTYFVTGSMQIALAGGSDLVQSGITLGFPRISRDADRG